MDLLNQINRIFGDSPLELLWLWLVLVNFLAFSAMGSDKQRARRKLRRIPEKTLIWLAALGGSPGEIAGMYLFRHKTLHKKFNPGLLIMLVLQLAFAAYTYFYYRA